MVHFKISGGEIEPTVEISISEFVFDLKSKIEDELEVEIHRQNLWYKGIEMENDKRIGFYALCGDETENVTLVVNPLPPGLKLHVLVKFHGRSGDGYVRVVETDKVSDLRRKVSRYWGIPINIFTLRRFNVEMADDRPLHAYYINHDSEIKLCLDIQPR
ncbi:ubiquitin-like protein-NEDD8-like protein RUB3 [Cicer arietinum]|uniref:ubiquitin-like protein-NEDD8-like protein RUB3 n=1 Tax=Cicer arietinum TaxID=3827 RepID=UPI003CC5E56C